MSRPPAGPPPLAAPPDPVLVQTPRGPARVYLRRSGRSPAALVALGHGAGGGVAAPDLSAVAAAALGAGLAVALIEQPYRVAGRRAPPAAPILDDAWLATLGWVRRQRGLARVPLVVGGRSSGARVACRTATAAGAAAVVALAFPVHPPGRPERDRTNELASPTVPVLVVQGDRDRFGMPSPAPGRTVHVVPGADHALRRDAAGTAAAVLRWLAGHGLAPAGEGEAG